MKEKKRKMISGINCCGLIKLVLHYWANNSFTETKQQTQCLVNNIFQAFFFKIWYHFNNFYLPHIKWNMHWYERPMTDRQMGNIYLGNFVKCTFLVQVEFYKAVAVCALSTHGIAHTFRAFLPLPPAECCAGSASSPLTYRLLLHFTATSDTVKLAQSIHNTTEAQYRNRAVIKCFEPRDSIGGCRTLESISVTCNHQGCIFCLK